MKIEFEFHNTSIIPDVEELLGRGDGRYQVRTDQDVVIFAQVYDGQIVNFEAEADGRTTPVFYLDERGSGVGLSHDADGGSDGGTGGPSWICTRCGDHICCYSRQ